MRDAGGVSRFVGRERELRVLGGGPGRPEPPHPLYGRRRVGESTLLLHFLRDRPALSFLGKQSPAQLQLAERGDFT